MVQTLLNVTLENQSTQGPRIIILPYEFCTILVENVPRHDYPPGEESTEGNA